MSARPRARRNASFSSNSSSLHSWGIIAAVTLLITSTPTAQTSQHIETIAPAPTPRPPPPPSTRVTADDLVRRALQANRELAAARLDFERGRARLRQAGL